MAFIDELKKGGLKLEKALWEKTKKMIFASGEMAPEGTQEKRVNVCKNLLGENKPCPYYGQVAPFPTEQLKLEGCESCGCPFETKARMVKAFGQTVKCPHPDGNKWANL
jgi:hypothetical protein